jgi:hypothetical protein
MKKRKMTIKFFGPSFQALAFAESKVFRPKVYSIYTSLLNHAKPMQTIEATGLVFQFIFPYILNLYV